MFDTIIKFFKSLNSNSHPGEMAHGAALGVLFGLMPKDNALWFILFFFFIFVRINKSLYFLITLLVSTIAPLTDNILHQLGYWVLLLPSLEPIMRTLLEIPFVAFTKINNTVVMGSLTMGLLLYIPVYLLTRLFVRLWRTVLAEKIAQSKLWKAVKSLPFIRKIIETSEKISDIREKYGQYR